MRVTRVGWRSVGLAVAVALLALGCGSAEDESDGDAAGGSPSVAVTTEPDTSTEPEVTTLEDELPDPVADMRTSLIEASVARDYAALAELVEVDVFLSDSGFGKDPLPAWQEQGERPFLAIVALLGLPHAVRETNEGTLYHWPRFDTGSRPTEASPAEEKVLETLLGDELFAVFNEEIGYAGPRLGILADGTWWFLVLEPGA